MRSRAIGEQEVVLILRISQARRQLLGLNAPARSEVMVGGVDLEAQRARALELLEAVRAMEESDGVIDLERAVDLLGESGGKSVGGSGIEAMPRTVIAASSSRIGVSRCVLYVRQGRASFK